MKSFASFFAAVAVLARGVLSADPLVVNQRDLHGESTPMSRIMTPNGTSRTMHAACTALRAERIAPYGSLRQASASPHHTTLELTFWLIQPVHVRCLVAGGAISW